MPAKEHKKVRGVYEDPRGSEIWWIQYFDKGRRRRERVGRRGDAINLVQIRRTQILRGEKLPESSRKRVLFGDLLDSVVAATATHKSASDYVTKAKLAKKALGGIPAEDITGADLRTFIEKRGVGNGTFNRYRAFFSLVFREAIMAKRVRTNPAKDLRLKKESKGRLRFLEREDEYPAVLASMYKNYPERVDAFVFSVYSGARLDEQFELLETGCNFKRREVTFTDTKHGDDRTIPMNSVMYEILRRLIPEGRRPQKVKVFGSKHDFCLKTKAKKKDPVPLERESPWWFTDLCADLGITDYSWHSNRHTFCSWHALAGTPIRTIYELAGHKTIATTMRYAHLSPEHQHAEGERIVVAASKPNTKVIDFSTASRTANA